MYSTHLAQPVSQPIYVIVPYYRLQNLLTSNVNGSITTNVGSFMHEGNNANIKIGKKGDINGDGGFMSTTVKDVMLKGDNTNIDISLQNLDLLENYFY